MQAIVAVRYAATDERPGGSPGAAASSQRLPAELLAMPVLIIEDEGMIAWMLESLLEDMGFETLVVVASGEEALEAARREPPGLISATWAQGALSRGIEQCSTPTRDLNHCRSRSVSETAEIGKPKIWLAILVIRSKLSLGGVSRRFSW